ncbi:hypothetical protein [Halodesulfovibrio aestuarii]|uniref:hypothetical protein n=1 Tax=Halodesulfovibrio aestuarii TaxID=126333 RepID=UPI003D3452F1
MQNHYFNEHGYYTYTGYANSDNVCPLTATRTAPEKIEGYHPKWNGEAWEYVQDMRGTKYYMPDGSEHEIIEIEGQLPEGASLTKPAPPEPTYAELRQAAILEKWSMAAQLEALTEAAENPARPKKMNQLLADIQEIKAQYPKPETLQELSDQPTE